MPIRRKTSDQLRDLTVVAQCLDNQWLPPELAEKLDGVRGYESLGKHRKDSIRRELIGALLTSEQLILNRAYAYTNDVLGDICSHPTEKEDLLKIFDKELMVLFFAGEQSLDDKVEFQVHDHHLAGNQLKALQNLFSNADIPCLRFDWSDNTRNGEMLADYLARPFHSYIQTLDTVAADRLAVDLKIPEQKREQFALKIYEMATFAHSKR